MSEIKTEIKLIALDMDGTLLNSEHEVSEATREAIAEALAKDVHVVLSTGRWLQSCHPYAESLKLTSYLVTANGGEIWTVNKELVEQHLLKPEKIEKMYTLAKEIGLSIWMISTEGVYRDSAPDNFYDHKWLKFGCESYNESRLSEMMKQLSYIEGLELTNSLPTNMEVNPKGVSKASALETVCEKIGISMKEIMAVGDSLNDMKMIQEAGIGVAMGNAQDAIKQAANYVTDTNNNDGVAKAIHRFVL
ncbi:MAG: Cof-type HAD-IIB family hydrolase [Bacillota bacterium]|uniref:Cof-type HAD-IIB family hydrolase n=1 Tax=Virgibacillus TaxID=84406 RepID=UPI000402F655|nr:MULTISPECIES: Cof-type HAD-IIB family hydrolase [Bacillaceae]MCC2250766.1 Cof-type HAD-IIB family hydrolase [Virgibacillus sp. AGTR]MDY7042846.1 Cof-type HAD-IIB family hydrolase [Virgibacillus sp. M23]QRZ18062.1 HAD family phosphatase [Virgibacillus sp. AGTR]WBX78618.1 Cof-type HAD-IIB family hydrolase [Virgibacillus salarius]